MKRTWMWCLAGLLSLGSYALSQDKQAGGGTEKAVAALEQQWLRHRHGRLQGKGHRRVGKASRCS